MTSILDRLVPLRTIVRRPRPSDPWFDHDCRQAKRVTRRLERAYAAACRRATTGVGSAAVVDNAKAAWYDQRRRYRELLQSKRSSLWKPTGHLRRSCGSQSTSCWDAGNFRPVQQSASMTLTGSSRTKSARSDRELLEHQSRRIQQFGQVHHCLRSPPYRLPTSRRPSRNCRTKALPLTHCQCRR